VPVQLVSGEISPDTFAGNGRGHRSPPVPCPRHGRVEQRRLALSEVQMSGSGSSSGPWRYDASGGVFFPINWNFPVLRPAEGNQLPAACGTSNRGGNLDSHRRLIFRTGRFRRSLGLGQVELEMGDVTRRAAPIRRVGEVPQYPAPKN